VEGVQNPHQVPFLPYGVCRGPMDPLESLQGKEREESARPPH